MKPTNYGENCNQCKMTVSLSNPRKKVILKEHYNDETYYLSLTDEQIALLAWVTENIFDAGYEVVDTLEFETI
jgi:methionyl-tRNA synthetase